MKKKDIGRMVPVLICAAILLTGCRTRTAGSGTDGTASGNGGTADERMTDAALPAAEETDDAGSEENEGESGGLTKENPDASRKEYDEDAPAEILPGTERFAEGEGEGTGSPRENPEAEQSAVQLRETAREPAVQTVSAEEAEDTGAAEDGKEADSALTYYSVLLRDRTESLYECKRLNAYLETDADHVTIHKSSAEHSLILDAGMYDVSARLLEGNLQVDDGWIGRKNPGMIIKMTDTLGTGIHSASSAREVYNGLLAREGWRSMDAVRNGRVLLLSGEVMETPWLRLFAALAAARIAYPDLMEDVDLDQALEMLVQEAAGSAPGGIYYYTGGT